MDLSSVPFFKRPMSAREDDPWTGNMDEAGNLEYRTVTGQTYFVKPDPDQRTTRTKVEEDVVPAVKEYLKDPSLPSAEQMKQFGSAMVEGAVESLEGAVSGTGTMGDAFGVAPVVGMAGKGADLTVEALGQVAKKTPEFLASEEGAIKIPRFQQKGTTDKNYPNAIFGSRELRDVFDEDLDSLDFVISDEGEFLSGPNLGYAPRLRVHDLANIKLGRQTVEEAIDYVGTDPEPEVVQYVKNRLLELEENPEFQEYVEKYRRLNEEYDPYDAINVEEVRDPYTPATFRSAIPELIGSLTYPAKGIKGSQVLKEIQDSPSIRGSEFTSLGVKIEPDKRYTKEELSNLFEGKLWEVSAKILREPSYGAYQRQEVRDPEVDYFELVVGADRQDGDTFKARSQHFEDNTLSHARASVRADNWTGQNYILLEELQSDLLQKGFETKPKFNADQVYINYGLDLPESALTEFMETSDQEITEGLRIAFDINQYGKFNAIPEEAKKALEQFVDNSSQGSYRAYRIASDFLREFSGYDFEDVNEILTDLRDDLKVNLQKGPPRPPIQKTEEGVRIAFDGLLAEAANRGVSRVVIPPFERIVAERFTPGSPSYLKAIEPSSGFYATYKKALDKVLKEYEQELGRGNFSTRLIDMDYPPVGYLDPKDPNKIKTIDLPVTGIEVDFKGAIDNKYDFTRPKFAEGGLVQNYNQGGSVSMDEQMELFQEGGIADDGMNRDPVSGNEVPPGSLASEVRDDVDAKLSEGEYVVPADVVRYFGVGYFEKLRDKAKKALAEMEANGRIGGEPLPEGLGGEDELPFSDEELMVMGDSGSEAPVGMAEGGSVKSTFNPQAYATGYTTPTTGNIQTKTYRNAAGEMRSIMFVGGQPIQAIPPGFVEDTPENRSSLTKQKEAVINAEEKPAPLNQERGGGISEGDIAEAPDYSSMNAEDLAEAAKSVENMSVIGTVASVLGVPFGAQIANKAEKDAKTAINNRAKELDIQPFFEPEEDKSILGKAKDSVNAIGYSMQGAGTSSRGKFGYGLSAGEQEAATNSYAGMSEDSPGYADPYGEGYGPGGPNAGGQGDDGDNDNDTGGTSYGGYMNRGGLVSKKAKQKKVTKPQGKGLATRKK